VDALTWLGRRGPSALAAMIVIGIATPPLGAALRPYVAEAVFLLLTLAFLRADLTALGVLARRPARVLAVVAWTMGVTPLAVLAAAGSGALAAFGPDMTIAFMLQAASLPMMAAPALAALVGLDATFALAGLLLASLLMPLTSPAILALGDVGVAMSGVDLAFRLAGMLAGSALLGLGLRRAAGAGRVRAHREAVDGVNLVVLFVFVSSVMGDVGPALAEDAAGVVALALIGVVANLVLLIVTWAAFAAVAGARTGLAAGLLASQRNLGLMLAVAGPSLSETVWLYFAVSQIPIYLAPAILRPLARRIGI